MKYGCIGRKLPHSFSKIIHDMIGKYDYELCEIEPENLDAFMRGRDFCGINVTIPYKEAVIPYLDDVDERARSIGAVNTVVKRGDRLIGYNTDYPGMLALARRTGITLAGKKVLILGTGGTSKTALHVCLDAGARSVERVSRSARDGAVTYADAEELHADAQVIINTTPCGMFPNVTQEPLIDLSRFTELTGVIDAVYNPLDSMLVQRAREAGVSAAGGLFMLVSQAVYASEYFTGEKAEDIAEDIFGKILREKKNTVLFGMPSSGKTTVGRLLAEATGREFIDIDEYIEKSSGKSPAEIIRESGEETFRRAESEAVYALAPLQGKVIACGGGTVLRRENVRALRLNGELLWLDRPLGELTPTDNRPLADDMKKMEELYRVRKDIYKSSCDRRIGGSGSAEAVLARIIGEENK